MTDWVPLLLPYLAGVLTLGLLGAPVAFGLRTRGFMFLIVTVPAAFASVAVASILTHMLGLTWSLLPPLVFSVVLGIAMRVITSRVMPPPTHDASRSWGWPITAVAFTAVVTAHTLTNGIPDASSISQTYDAVFHLNATKHILDTGVASPLAIDVSSPGNPSFYPTLWHATTVLMMQLTGSTVAVATNAMTFLVTTVVWGIGAVALGRAVAGPGRIATISSGILASVFPSLPLGLAAFGVLYPNLLAMTLLPYVLVGFAQLGNTAGARVTESSTPVTATLLTVGAIGAATLAHPNALHATYLFAVGFVLVGLFQLVRRGEGVIARWALPLLGLLAFAAAGAFLWFIGRTTINPWGGSQGPFGALLEALGTAPRFDGHNWVITGLMLLGALLAGIRHRYFPYLASFGIVLGFYVLADGFPPNPIRELFLSPWYSDPWRLAALLPLAMLPLGVIALTLLCRMLEPAFHRFMSLSVPVRNTRTGIATLSLVGVGFALAATSLYPAATYLADRYGMEAEDPRLLSEDEEALIMRLDSVVSEDARILVNPWNGGSLAYALGNRMVSHPHMTGTYDERIWIAAEGIAKGTDAACEAATDLDVGYVLDFGTRYVFVDADLREELEEISGITYAPALTEVDREGKAVLYEITGCNGKETS